MIRKDDPWYKDYKETLLEHGINLPEKAPCFDYDEARKEGRQIYFNALFDKSEYCRLVEKLVVKSGNKKITFSELKNFRFDFFEYSSRPKFVESSTLRQVSDDDSDNRIVLNTILQVENWKRFIAEQAYEILRHDNKITINDYQKEHFQAYCNELLACMDFSKAFKDEEVFGLYNSLYKAYVNLADNDFEAVTDHLQSVVQSDYISEEERSFCNTVLLYIEQLYNQRSGIEWTIPKIKTFWNKVNM